MFNRKKILPPVDFAISNEMRFNVLPQRPECWDFWGHFNGGTWEPETFSFYKKYVQPNKDVIDIGGWIGPTMIIAYSFNPRNICVVEADPANYQILKHNCFANYMQDKVSLHNLCISDRSGDIVGFGYTDKSNSDTSTCSMNGDRVRVLTTGIVDFLKTKDLYNTSIIKIDVEGAESLLSGGLNYISEAGVDINILLSFHPPFWSEPKKDVAEKMLPAIKKFDIFSEADVPLDVSDVEKMMLDERNSEWVGRTGIFFSLILKTRR